MFSGGKGPGWSQWINTIASRRGGEGVIPLQSASHFFLLHSSHTKFGGVSHCDKNNTKISEMIWRRRIICGPVGIFSEPRHEKALINESASNGTALLFEGGQLIRGFRNEWMRRAMDGPDMRVKSCVFLGNNEEGWEREVKTGVIGKRGKEGCDLGRGGAPCTG